MSIKIKQLRAKSTGVTPTNKTRTLKSRSKYKRITGSKFKRRLKKRWNMFKSDFKDAWTDLAKQDAKKKKTRGESMKFSTNLRKYILEYQQSRSNSIIAKTNDKQKQEKSALEKKHMQQDFKAAQQSLKDRFAQKKSNMDKRARS